VSSIFCNSLYVSNVLVGFWLNLEIKELCTSFFSLRVSLHYHRMWSVVSRTSQNEQFGVSVFSMMSRWMALVYPVLRRDIITCSLLLSLTVSFYQLTDVFRFFISFSSLSHLSCLLLDYSFFIHFIKS
jgi:hypothetical protein